MVIDILCKFFGGIGVGTRNSRMDFAGDLIEIQECFSFSAYF